MSNQEGADIKKFLKEQNKINLEELKVREKRAYN